MVGMIMQSAGAAASLAASLIEDKEIITQHTTYNPDPMSFKDAGLYNNSVDLGEQKTEKTRTESPFIKDVLSMVGSLSGSAGSIVDATSETA